MIFRKASVFDIKNDKVAEREMRDRHRERQERVRKRKIVRQTERQG